MPQYDSESSADEDNDYAKTNVVLGFAAKDSADNVDTISHLGGRPQWLDPTTPPSASLARCKVCKDTLVLLLQLNADLPEVFSGHERRLYVFECRRKSCRRKEGSVRALRGTRVTTSQQKDNRKPVAQTKEVQPNTPVANIGETLFGTKPTASNGGAANPFSPSSSSFANPYSKTSSSMTHSNNPFAALPTSELAAKSPQASSPSTSPTKDLPQSFSSALSLNLTPSTSRTQQAVAPPEPWPPEKDLPKAYPQYYLEDDMEWLEKIPGPEIHQTPAIDIDEGSGSGGKEDRDVYESTIDRTFQKFADRLAQNPEQVIRYEFKGQPLLYTKSDEVAMLFRAGGSLAGEGKVNLVNGSEGGNSIPRCGKCGARRVFEVQLCPHAIMELERAETGLDGMEWGTVLVGVCEKDCGQDEGGVSYVEEWAGVQWEELKK